MKLSSREQVLSFYQARQVVENQAKHFKPAATEKVSLNRSLNRFLALPIRADRDFPPFSRATRDGFGAISRPV
jgi:molybdopterin molybdotransferase